MKEFKFVSKKKKEKINLLNGSNSVSDIEKTSGFRLEVFFNRTVTAEGCLGVVDYKDDYIKIRVKKGYLIITGKSMNIMYFEDKTIKIDGTVVNIELCV